MGADTIINPAKDDLNAQIMKLTNNEGVPVVVEATGVPSVMENTENLVAAGGRIVIAGLTNDKVAFTGINFTRREMTILGSRNSTNIFPFVVESLANHTLHPEKLITRKFPFASIIEAMRYAAENLQNEGKIILEF